MSVAVVCGINWGDEGKGRMVDYLAGEADVVVRYQGGNNAGHTVVNEHGTFVLHLVPSGVFREGILSVLGPGMVIDLDGLQRELGELEQAGFSSDRVVVSDRATIAFPFHRDEDTWEEIRLGKNAFGSTRQGIAPAYGDRAMKRGIQLGELLHPDALRPRLQRIVELKRLLAKNLYGQEPSWSFNELFEWAVEHGRGLRDRICDTTVVLEEAARAGKRIMLEAQLGALRDVYFGIYPFTTSSCTLAPFAPLGSGLFSAPVDRVIGVMKAFSTCVGEGPFVTSMSDDEADALRETAMEFGATTGRPRRIGHFDAVASRFGAAVQSATDIALTKLDSLSGRTSLQICTHYEIDGERTDRFPLTPALERAVPIYREFEGWDEDVTGCRKFDDLPPTAQRYVSTIEELVQVPVRWISVGPHRDQLIEQ